LFGKQVALENVPNYAAKNVAYGLKYKTELALKEAGILDNDGKLTSYAVENSTIALSKGSVLSNPSVVEALTKDGSNIAEWSKFATPSIKLPFGQKIEVHFYKKMGTMEVNYSHPDFKVKGIVDAIPRQQMQDSLVNQYFNPSF
jgi:filamentous hemagglutinin